MDKLIENIEPEKTFRFGFSNKETKAYEGFVDRDRFRIRRIIRYRNSFLPRIDGSIMPEGFGTQIRMHLRLHRYVSVFLFVWMAGVAVSAGVLIAMGIKEGRFEVWSLLPVGMLLILYIAAHAAFRYESRKSKAFFRELFEAEEE